MKISSPTPTQVYPAVVMLKKFMQRKLRTTAMKIDQNENSNEYSRQWLEWIYFSRQIGNALLNTQIGILGKRTRGEWGGQDVTLLKTAFKIDSPGFETRVVKEKSESEQANEEKTINRSYSITDHWVNSPKPVATGNFKRRGIRKAERREAKLDCKQSWKSSMLNKEWSSEQEKEESVSVRKVACLETN